MSDFFHHIRQTLAIKPDGYSAKVSENRWRSFGYALAGMLHMVRYAKNLRIQFLAMIVVLMIGVWLQLTAIEWAILTLTIGINMLAEFLNAGVESAINLASPDYHPIAQVGKDVAAGGALLTTIMAVIVAALLLMPPLWDKLSI